MYNSSRAKEDFISICIRGEVLPEEIDDFIEAWHNSDSKLELHDFLGMTWDEYSAWVADTSILPLIITSHRTQIPLVDLMENTLIYAAAARSRNPEKAEHIIKWLREQGKLS